MSTTGLSNTWDLFPNRTLGRVGKREPGMGVRGWGGGGVEQSNLFIPCIFGCFLQTCVEDPLHSCGGFEVLKAERQKQGFIH